MDAKLALSEKIKLLAQQRKDSLKHEPPNEQKDDRSEDEEMESEQEIDPRDVYMEDSSGRMSGSDIDSNMKEGSQQDSFLGRNKQTEQDGCFQDGQNEGTIEDQNAQIKQFYEIKMYSSNLKHFQKRRAQKFVEGKVDLGVLYIQELVYMCYEEGLITRDLMLMIRNFSITSTLDFIKKYRQQSLCDFNFQLTKFTIFDHRRLAEMLVAKDQSSYLAPHDVFCMPFEAYSFLQEIYKMPLETYHEMCEEFDRKYDLLWWPSIREGRKGLYEEPVQANQPQQEEQKVPQKPAPKVAKKVNEKKTKKEEKKPKELQESEQSSSLFDSDNGLSFTVTQGKESHPVSGLSDMFSGSEDEAPVSKTSSRGGNNKGGKNAGTGRKQKKEQKKKQKSNKQGRKGRSGRSSHDGDSSRGDGSSMQLSSES